MIGRLLGQIPPALGRFLGYHTRRLFVRRQEPAQAQSANQTSEALVESGLDSYYLQPVEWPCHRIAAPPDELTSNPLYRLWATIPGGLKWTHYFPAYEAIFGPRRTDPLRILEIGVHEGASLRLWRRYFSNPGTTIVGIDILADCRRYEAPDDGVHVRIGNQVDEAFLNAVVGEFGPFDLIIDDGSHRSSHLIASFNHLFANGLDERGIYFAEDLHTNFWSGWRDTRRSFLDLCMELARCLQAQYQSAPQAAFMVNRPSDQPLAAITVPRITTMIQEIRFFDSMIAIYKARRRHVPYMVRTQ